MGKPGFIFIATFFSFVVPLALIWWTLKMKFNSRGELLFKSLAAYLALFALYFINNWSIFSYYLGIWWLMIPVLFIGYNYSLHPELPWSAKPVRNGWWGLFLAFVLFTVSIPVIFQSRTAKSVPANAVELDFPLKGWRYYIAHGGSRTLLNAHVRTIDSNLYRGQTWALDILQMGWVGNRARGVYPADPERYHIFGQPVYAPCNGEVTQVENELEDLRPPRQEQEKPAGNFVQIQCGENIYVILAHLQQYSVRVQAGDVIDRGEVLGLVGNSGNTSEPHLHIHAQTGPGRESLLNADPLPVVFRHFGFLTRNDIVRNR